MGFNITGGNDYEYCNGSSWVSMDIGPVSDSSCTDRKISNPSPGTDDIFGRSVAVDGELMVIGKAHSTTVGTAYIFDATTGTRLFTLNNPNSTVGDNFAGDVDISGTTVVVGSSSYSGGGVSKAGRAYIYSATTGSLLRTIENPYPGSTDLFGASVAISGNRVVVGAYNDDAAVSNAGRAFVFNASTGALISTLENPTPLLSDYFGEQVAIDGTIAVIGSYGQDIDGYSSAGNAYAFDADSGNLIATLENPNPSGNGQYGRGVGISGTTAIIGAPWDDPGGTTAAGAAYLFNASNGTYIRQLVSPEKSTSDWFGTSVAIDGDIAVVGTTGEDPAGVSSAGAAYAFDISTGNAVKIMHNPEPDSSDYFGEAVAISGDFILVGAYWDDPGGINNTGTSYLFCHVAGLPCTTSGEMYYHDTYQNIVWCDGAELRSTDDADGAGGAGCSSPSAKAGAMDFRNSAYYYCDGSTWKSIP